MARRQLPDPCPLCQICHTAHQQLLCYQELQTRIEKSQSGRPESQASAKDRRAWLLMSDFMNKHRL